MTPDELVLAHLSYCDMPARLMWLHIGGAIPLDDLVQYARIGLLKAARKFDAARGLQFWTFARHLIHGAMLDGIRKENGRGLKQQPPLLSLSLPLPLGEKGEAAPDEKGPDEARILLAQLERRVRNLNPKALAILRLTALDGYSQKEAAQIVGCSQPAASVLRKRALQALKRCKP
jgi:RNA polymerase sigma factor (sigma-70 family)